MKKLFFTILIAGGLYLQADLVYAQSNISVSGSASIILGSGTNISAGSVTGTVSGSGTINGGPLPVELISFTAEIGSNGIVLKWNTATEVNNYGFEVERLQNYRVESFKDSESKWEKAGFVKGSGNSNSPKYYEFADKQLLSGKYLYRLKQIDIDGSFAYSEEIDIEIGATPLEFNLAQNYPNPFNPETIIEFTVPETGLATLKVYDVPGEEVATLFNEAAEAGKFYQVRFNASHLAAGVYIARLQAGSEQLMKKMIYMK